jgi:uroporphyrinogen-III synthase
MRVRSRCAVSNGGARAQVRIDLSAAEPSPQEVLEAIRGVDVRGRGAGTRYGETSRNSTPRSTAAGAVAEVPTYRWALPADMAPLADCSTAVCGTIDCVVFTSASQMRNLFTVAPRASTRRGCRPAS